MEALSDCCSAEEWNETHLCSSCKEYAEFEEEEEFVSQRQIDWIDNWKSKQV